MKPEEGARFLEVTYRSGRPWAAYLQLPRSSGQRPFRSRPAERGLVVDLARDGRPLGIEITAPRLVQLADVNRLLKQLGVPPITKAEFRPLDAA